MVGEANFSDLQGERVKNFLRKILYHAKGQVALRGQEKGGEAASQQGTEPLCSRDREGTESCNNTGISLAKNLCLPLVNGASAVDCSGFTCFND